MPTEKLFCGLFCFCIFQELPVHSHKNTMRSTFAEIDLRAIHHNLKQIRKKIGRRPLIMAVVKANAYGHGMIPVVSSIVKNKTAQYFGVAIVEEGIELRKSFPRIPIHVLTAPDRNQLDLFIQNNLELTLCDAVTARKLNALCKKLKKKCNVHIKIDTGMGRIGIAPDNAIEFIRSVLPMSHIQVKGIWTHFATSDEKDLSFANQQLSTFRALLTELVLQGIHIPLVHSANSGAVLQMPESYFDMVRPGITIYGYPPSTEVFSTLKLRPALSFKAKVGFLKRVEAGTSISYGRRYIAKTDTTIASVTVGYADGYFRLLTNNAYVLIKGKKFPIAGTVCMDQIMIDVGDENVRVGDEVVLIGQSGAQRISSWDIANAIGTIPYEVTCAISQRVPRRYIHGS